MQRSVCNHYASFEDFCVLARTLILGSSSLGSRIDAKVRKGRKACKPTLSAHDRLSDSRSSRSAFIISCSVTYLGSANHRSTAAATASSIAIRASVSSFFVRTACPDRQPVFYSTLRPKPVPRFAATQPPGDPSSIETGQFGLQLNHAAVHQPAKQASPRCAPERTRLPLSSPPPSCCAPASSVSFLSRNRLTTPCPACTIPQMFSPFDPARFVISLELLAV